MPVLESEWQSIVNRSAPKTRMIWRSGGFNTDFVEQVRVTVDGRIRRTKELLQFHPEWAARLHERDRVHTYGSFSIADLNL